MEEDKQKESGVICLNDRKMKVVFQYSFQAKKFLP